MTPGVVDKAMEMTGVTITVVGVIIRILLRRIAGRNLIIRVVLLRQDVHGKLISGATHIVKLIGAVIVGSIIIIALVQLAAVHGEMTLGEAGAIIHSVLAGTIIAKAHAMLSLVEYVAGEIMAVEAELVRHLVMV